jgi:hypothetical protein
MLGTKPGRFWLGTWCIAAPVFLGVKIKIPNFCRVVILFLRVLFFRV